jgi:GT2 family glycosyltransferase
MQVDIIIPTLLKNPSFLQECLNSVQEMQSKHEFNLYVMANVERQKLNQFKTSFQATFMDHQSKNPLKNRTLANIYWHALGSNFGFAQAVNEGVLLGSSPLIALLNDDTVVAPNWLDTLVSTHLQTSSAMVASHILLFESKSIDSLGFTFFWRGKATSIQNFRLINSNSSTVSRLAPDHWLRVRKLLNKSNITNQRHSHQSFQVENQHLAQEPFGPDAAAALYTRELWNKLGGMNQAFFAYLEDVDFALRARLLGYNCALAKEAKVYHHKHATSTHFSSFKAKQDVVNWWRIVLVTYPKSIWFRFALKILIERAKNISGLLKSLLNTQTTTR